MIGYCCDSAAGGELTPARARCILRAMFAIRSGLLCVHQVDITHGVWCAACCRQLELRRQLDVDGWAADVTALRKTLAAVDRKLLQMRLIDR